MGSILDKIKSSTEFEVVEDTKTFTNRGGLSSPLMCVDTIIGGKIPFGSVVDLFGPPGSGKSSYGYECVGLFQKEHPEGIACVIDTESSIDTKRLRALGVDTSKLLVLKAATLESGYKQILALLKEVSALRKKDRVPVVVIWDSLSNAPTDAQLLKENVTGGGIAEAPRINKDMLKLLNYYLDEVDCIIFLVNQVSSKIGTIYQVGGGWGESGGNALKHAIHYKLEFAANKSSFNTLGMAETSATSVKITKNKLGPLTKEMPFTISNLEGGKIDRIYSFWQHIDPIIAEKIKGNTYRFITNAFVKMPKFHQYLSVKYPKVAVKFNWYDIINLIKQDKDEGGVFLDFLQLYWCLIISDKYTLQAEVVAPLVNDINSRIDKYFKDNSYEGNYTYIPTETSKDDDDDEDGDEE